MRARAPVAGTVPERLHDTVPPGSVPPAGPLPQEPSGLHPLEARGAGRARSVSRRAFLALLLLALFALAVLVFPDQGVGRRGKALLLETSAGLLFIWAALHGEWSAARLRAALRSAPNLFVLLLAAWITLSALRSDLPAVSLYEGLRHLGGVMLYFAVLYGLPARYLARLCAGLSAIVAVVALLALTDFGNRGAQRISGAFQDAQLLAGFLSVTLPVVAAAAIVEDRLWWRNLAVASAVLALAAILVTNNRSAWLGCLAGLVVLAFLVLGSRGRHGGAAPGLRLLLVPLLTLAVAAGMFFWVTRQGSAVVQRAATFSGLGQDVSFGWRRMMWGCAVQMVRERPVAGWGIGTFPYQQSLFNPQSPDQRTIAHRGPSLAESAHNTYLQLAADTGLVGLSLYLLVLGSFFHVAVAALPRQREPFRRAVLIGSVTAVTVQAVTALGSPAWEYPECSGFFWVMLAVGMLAAGVAERGSPADNAGREQTGRRRGFR